MKLIHWPTFFITIISSLIVLYLFISLRLKMPLDCNFKRRRRVNFIRRARTGDIICVGYGSMRAKLVKVFTGSMWAHSAVVVRAQGEHSCPYVLEVARHSRKKSGIMVTPLASWLEENSHNTVAYSPYQGSEITDECMGSFLEAHEGKKIEMLVLKWLSAMMKRSYTSHSTTEKKRKVFCSELVAHFLQSVGILRKKYSPNGYKPWELLYGKLDLSKESKYGKPHLII